MLVAFPVSHLLGDDFLVSTRLCCMANMVTPTLKAEEAWKRFFVPLDQMIDDEKLSWGRAIMVKSSESALVCQ